MSLTALLGWPSTQRQEVRMTTIMVNLITVNDQVLDGLLCHPESRIRLAARKEIMRREARA